MGRGRYREDENRSDAEGYDDARPGWRRGAVLLAVGALGAVLVACSTDDDTAAESTPSTAAQRSGDSAASDDAGATCETAAEVITSRIAGSLIGEPPPTIAEAQTASFTVDGDQGRIVVVVLDGPGVDGQQAVFAIGPSGTVYAEDAFAQEFSSLEPIGLSAEWDDEIDSVRACIQG